ncbi:unnamed protein product [Gongylonema pulchrum]|uniref:DUF3452 domain-containing protein n=1 Tax=Gongylonema pulchrum TaxID=637853 RepID=A0A183D5U6_9BILA|nr:unnamed protein product [Gongylonema pulchrum]VDN40414.1 unnamed protein product [Gongylonema pulchrum]
MINGPRRLQEHVSRVQSSLAITAVVYKKLLPIFRKVFSPPAEDDDSSERVTCKKLFNLLWSLFIVMRS